jgi:hypothetical protein
VVLVLGGVLTSLLLEPLLLLELLLWPGLDWYPLSEPELLPVPPWSLRSEQAAISAATATKLSIFFISIAIVVVSLTSPQRCPHPICRKGGKAPGQWPERQ